MQPFAHKSLHFKQFQITVSIKFYHQSINNAIHNEITEVIVWKEVIQNN